MDNVLPIRVKLDFSRIVTVQYRFVWFPVLRCSLSRISDLKTSVCDKYNLSYNDTELFLSGALLREDDTVLLLREDDVIQVVQKEQSNDDDIDHPRSKKRKRKNTIEGDGNSTVEDTSRISEHSKKSDAEANELQPPAKIKKKDKHKGKRISINENAEIIQNIDEDVFLNVASTSSHSANDNTLVFEKKSDREKKKEIYQFDVNPSPMFQSTNKNLLRNSQSTPISSFNIDKKAPKATTSTENTPNDCQSTLIINFGDGKKSKTVVEKEEKHVSGNITVDQDGLMDKQSLKKMLSSSPEDHDLTFGVKCEVNSLNPSVLQSGDSSCQKKKRKRRRRRRKCDASEFLPNVDLTFQSQPNKDLALRTPESRKDNAHIRFESFPVDDSDSDDRLFISLPRESSVDASFSSLVTNENLTESVNENSKFDTPFLPELTPIESKAKGSNDCIVSTQKLAQKTAPRSLYSQQAKRSKFKPVETLGKAPKVSEMSVNSLGTYREITEASVSEQDKNTPQRPFSSDAKVNVASLSSNAVGSSFTSPYNSINEIGEAGFSKESGLTLSQRLAQISNRKKFHQSSPLVVCHKSNSVTYQKTNPVTHQESSSVTYQNHKSIYSTLGLPNGKSPVISSLESTPQNQEGKKNYDVYPLLRTMPLVGSTVAFKLLELSDLYCPEVSDYKEGRIIAHDSATDSLTIELLKEEIKKTKTGKFENIYQSDSENEPEDEIVKNITCRWTELLQARLLQNISIPTN